MNELIGHLDRRFLAKSVGLLNPLPPLSVKASEPVLNALTLLRENKTGCVVVVNDDERLVGIFSERDVMLRLVLEGIDIGSTPMSELMTPAPQTIEMTTTFAYALSMMSEGGFRHLPILDSEQIPIGMISVKDIIDYIADGLSRDLTAIGKNL